MTTFLTTHQTADLYPLSVSHLANLRWRGIGPDFIKAAGGSRVLYTPEAVEAYLLSGIDK